MSIPTILSPPIPEDISECRTWSQKRRWYAHEALENLQIARGLVELASRLPDDMMIRIMVAAERLVRQAHSCLSYFEGELVASRLLLKWKPLSELEEVTEAYFQQQIGLLDRIIRRLRFNMVSPTEILIHAAFGSPPPLSS